MGRVGGLSLGKGKGEEERKGGVKGEDDKLVEMNVRDGESKSGWIGVGAERERGCSGKGVEEKDEETKRREEGSGNRGRGER